ncbi:hypothetical protein BCR32DRAFT_326381, partial [Anaeromyces robustus]
MKFSILSCLLLVASYAYALPADNDDVIPSEACLNELSKYEACLEEIGDSGQVADSIDAVENICNKFNSENCKEFVQSSANELECIKESNDNIADKALGKSLASLQSVYLSYCAVDSNGNTCPFTDYISKASNNDLYLDTLTDMPDELLKALVNDCKDPKCNSRMVTLDRVTRVLYSDSDSKEKIFQVYVPYY